LCEIRRWTFSENPTARFYLSLQFIRHKSHYCGEHPPIARENNMSVCKRFLRDDSGATAIEYGLIAAGISVVIIGTVNTIGGQLKNTFNNISTNLGQAGK